MFCRTGSTALMEAVKYGHESMVRLILEHGADVNAADE
jgi:ankyrin repeat protein